MTGLRAKLFLQGFGERNCYPVLAEDDMLPDITICISTTVVERCWLTEHIVHIVLISHKYCIIKKYRKMVFF